MNVGQEFAVSALAAGLSHVIHHPLYMLKSQMMYYGPKFSPLEFFREARQHPGFLYRGELCTKCEPDFVIVDMRLSYVHVHPIMN